MSVNNPLIYKFAASRRDGPLVVLSYANGFMPQTYTRALSGLFPTYRVVAAHLRPMWDEARKAPALPSWRTFGEDLLVTLNSVTDLPVIAIGHSVGAIASAYAAIAEPRRFSHLILIDPVMLRGPALWAIATMRRMGRDARMPLVRQALRRGRHWESAEAAYQYFRGKKLFTRCSDDMVRTYAESITATDPDRGGVSLVYPPEWEAEIYRTLPTDVWSVPPALRERAIATLVLRAERSDVFSANSERRFARLYPDAQFVTIPDAGHLIPQEQPEAVAAAIDSFLKARPSPAPGPSRPSAPVILPRKSPTPDATTDKNP